MNRSVDGRNIQDFDIVEYGGFVVEPPVSPVGRAATYYNLTTKKLMLSVDGGVWKEIVEGAIDLSAYFKLDQTTPQKIINGYPINGSQPSFTYTVGKLTRVDYPSGFYKVLAYNGDGTLNTITYSNGTVKTFTYSSGVLQSIGVL